MGLPVELEPSMSQFTDLEKRSNPLLTIQAVIRERERVGLEAPKAQLLLDDMPNEFKAKQMLKIDVRQEDPSQYYDILGKIGSGAFARVFEVKRKSDGVICALKFVEPKSDADRQVIYNEVGIMLLC